MSRKLKEHPKPLSKKEWEFWNDRLGFFVQEFEDNISGVAREAIEVGEGNNNDHFLAGMAQGMWAVLNFIETRMVKDEKDKNRDIIKIRKIVKATKLKRRKRKYVKSGKYKKEKSIRFGYKKPKIVVHKHIGKTIRKKGGVLSSNEVMGILKRFYISHDKRQRVSTENVLNIAKSEGRVPKGITPKKAKKILADRFFNLNKKGFVIPFKKGRTNYYRLP